MPGKSTTNIHAVIGTDDVDVKRHAAELAARLGGTGEFGADVIDGQAENADGAAQRVYQTIEALNTFGFFGGAKLVWLKNANFLADDRTGGAEATVAAVEKLTETLKGGLPDGTRFLLSAGAVDKRRTFFKTLQKLGDVAVFDRIDNTKQGWEANAESIVRDAAQARGLKFSRESLELFTLYTGGDRRTIENEMEKLGLHLGTKRRDVTADEVRLLTPLSRAGVIFELGNALAARQLQRTLELMRQLLFHGESEIGILLATVIPTVRNLLLMKDLMSRHSRLKPPSQPFYFAKDLDQLGEDAVSHLPRTKEGKLNAYPLGIAAVHARNYTLPELIAALKACLDANVAMISSPTEKEVILGQLLVRIIGGRQSRYAA